MAPVNPGSSPSVGRARTFSSTGSDSRRVYWGGPPGMVAGLADHDRAGEMIAGSEALREDGKLAGRYRRESGFVDEAGQVRPSALNHFNALAGPGQVHEEALPAQVGRAQTLHGSAGEPGQNDPHRHRLADHQVGDGELERELRGGPHGGRGRGNHCERCGRHGHGFAVNRHHKPGHGEGAQVEGADPVVKRGPRLHVGAAHLQDLAVGAGADLQLGRAGDLARPLDGLFEGVEHDAIEGPLARTDDRGIEGGRGLRRRCNVDLRLRDHQVHQRVPRRRGGRGWGRLGRKRRGGC